MPDLIEDPGHVCVKIDKWIVLDAILLNHTHGTFLLTGVN